jgi:hypothetical protein
MLVASSLIVLILSTVKGRTLVIVGESKKLLTTIPVDSAPSQAVGVSKLTKAT